jgi:hypothetical protein
MVQKQKYITLAQAAQISPGRPSANAVWRWCRKGLRSRGGRRIRLEHVRIGGRIFTTELWVHEFGRRLAEADTEYFELDTSRDPAVVTTPPLTRRRQAAIERAERELRAKGV